jgi:hypothetical protein
MICHLAAIVFDAFGSLAVGENNVDHLATYLKQVSDEGKGFG